MTRWVIIAHLPILTTAVIVNFIGEMHSENLFLALINSAVYVVFFYGSEKHMADYYSKMQKNKPKKSINKVTDAFFIV